jgi:hypothetical protein
VAWVTLVIFAWAGSFHKSAVMQDKPAILLVLFVAWLFWFVFFLTAGI